MKLLVLLATYYLLANPTLILGGKIASGKSLLYGSVIISALILELGSIKILCGDPTSIISCREVYFNTVERFFGGLCDFCLFVL